MFHGAVGTERIERRKKTASERRSHRFSAEARAVQKLLRGLEEVEPHRGNELTKIGRSLIVAFRSTSDGAAIGACEKYNFNGRRPNTWGCFLSWQCL